MAKNKVSSSIDITHRNSVTKTNNSNSADTNNSKFVTVQQHKIKIWGAPPATKQQPTLSTHPLIHSILWNRGIRTPNELDYRLERLLPTAGLKQLPVAVELLYQALCQQQQVVVVGDFDSDGITSTALAVLALREFGLQHVHYFIPNRFEHGYGLTPAAVQLVQQQYHPNLIITVDNGIVNFEGAQKAKEAGIRIIITDHHLADASTPPADAIINPNQPGDAFGSKSLTGVGVILYLMLAFRQDLRQRGWFSDQRAHNKNEPNLAQYLDLVAIGTLADAAVLDYNNRLLIHAGLQRIRRGQTRLGILALLALTKRDASQISGEDIAFAIAPRLNAAGRLSDASLAAELLLTVNQLKAQQLAQQLELLNQQRKRISQEMEQQALTMLQEIKRPGQQQSALPTIVLYRQGWHQGINGIVASRIKERFTLPTIVFSDAKDGAIKGSARSIAQLNIRESFQQLAQQQPDLIEYFGGHAMAAGIKLQLSKLPHFIDSWGQQVQQMLQALPPDQQTGYLEVDDYLDATYLTLDTARQLQALGPWGNGFREPSFLGHFIIQKVDHLGANHLKMQLMLLNNQPSAPDFSAQNASTPQNTTLFEAVMFGVPAKQQLALQPNSQIYAIFKLAINNYNANQRLQLSISSVLT